MRAGRRVLAGLLAALVLAPAAGAQDAAAPLTLAEAVRLALERNLDLSIERLNPLISREQVREAIGAFDPLATAGVTYGRAERFLNNILEAEAESGLVVEETLLAEYPALTGRLVTGTQYALGLTTPVTRSNHPLRLFDEAYQAQLTLSLTQPLLRDFGVEINTVRIRQAEKGERAAALGVEARMLALIREVETQYWEVFYARRHVDTARASLELAEDLVERLRRAREAGLATALDVLEAETAVEARRSELARARTDLASAQAQLGLLIDPRPAVAVPRDPVTPPPDDGAPQDLGGMLARALAARPELRQQELVVERVALEERVAMNALQPRVDLVGGVGYNGLAGDGVNPNLRRGLPSRLRGRDTYSEAFNDFLTTDGNLSWSVGVRLQLPLGRNEAQARLAQVRLQRRQEELRLAQLRARVAVDVETAFHDVSAGAERLAAARRGVELAREQLRAQERDLAAGRTTVRRVLEAQEALARAEDAASRAWTDYAAARARLDAAQAASFETHRLVITR